MAGGRKSALRAKAVRSQEASPSEKRSIFVETRRIRGVPSNFRRLPCGAPWGAEEAEKGRELGLLSDNTLNSRVITRSEKHPHFTRDVTRESRLAQVEANAAR